MREQLASSGGSDQEALSLNPFYEFGTLGQS